jgi:hypothetical protein
VCNVSERIGACLLWGFLAFALAYGILMLAAGIILAVRSR